MDITPWIRWKHIAYKVDELEDFELVKFTTLGDKDDSLKNPKWKDQIVEFTLDYTTDACSN
jgi:hypothetical protein